MDDCPEEEGDCHRNEDGDDDGECFFGVHQVSDAESCRIMGELDDGQPGSTSQQGEDHGHGGRGWQTEGVEDIQQDNVGHHDGEEDTHQFVEEELLRPENAVSRDVHHAAAHGRSTEDSDGSDNHDGPELGGFGTDGGIEEVDRIVADSHPQVKDSQHE